MYTLVFLRFFCVFFRLKMTPEEKREKVSEFSLTQAVKYRTTRDFGRSFPHFLVYAQLKPQPFKDTHLEDFLSVVYAFRFIVCFIIFRDNFWEKKCFIFFIFCSEELEKSGKPQKVLQVTPTFKFANMNLNREFFDSLDLHINDETSETTFWYLFKQWYIFYHTVSSFAKLCNNIF